MSDLIKRFFDLKYDLLIFSLDRQAEAIVTSTLLTKDDILHMEVIITLINELNILKDEVETYISDEVNKDNDVESLKKAGRRMCLKEYNSCLSLMLRILNRILKILDLKTMNVISLKESVRNISKDNLIKMKIEFTALERACTREI